MKRKNYLEPGVDYKPFKLAAQLGRVASSPYHAAAAEKARVQRLMDESVVISLHDHCFVARVNLRVLEQVWV